MAKGHILTKKEKRLVDSFRNLLTKEGISFDKLLLFGSKVKGKNHKWSDIDLCVVSNDFGNDYHKELVRLNILANRVDPVIEVFPMTSKDLKDKFDSFASEIVKTGVLV